MVLTAQEPQQYGLARVMTNGDLVFQDAYEPTSILLTGGCGFIGSHVASLLATKYPAYKVRGDLGNVQTTSCCCDAS